MIILTLSCKQLLDRYLNLHLKFGAILSKTYKDMTLYPHMYQNGHVICFRKNFSIQEWPLYKGLRPEKYSECFFIFGAILNVTNSSFQKGMTFVVAYM